MVDDDKLPVVLVCACTWVEDFDDGEDDENDRVRFLEGGGDVEEDGKLDGDNLFCLSRISLRTRSGSKSYSIKRDRVSVE